MNKPDIQKSESYNWQYLISDKVYSSITLFLKKIFFSLTNKKRLKVDRNTSDDLRDDCSSSRYPVVISSISTDFTIAAIMENQSK